MNIKGIQTNQIQQGILRPAERSEYTIDIIRDSSSDPARLQYDALPNEARPVRVQLQGIINNIHYLQEQLLRLLTEYPPFFPPGSPQRLDLIKKVKGVQEEIEKVSGRTGDKKISSGDQKLKENATDAEIATAIEDLANFRKEVSQNGHLITDKPQPGTLLNIKI